MKYWKHYFINQLKNIIILLFLIFLFMIRNNKDLEEYFVGFIALYSIYLIVEKFFLRSNNYYMIIKTQKIVIIPSIFLCLFGLTFIFIGEYHEALAFNCISVRKAIGVFAILLSILSLRKDLIINIYGIHINEWLTRRIKFEELEEFNLNSESLVISNKDFSYVYKIYPLTDQQIELINNRIHEYQSLKH